MTLQENFCINNRERAREREREREIERRNDETKTKKYIGGEIEKASVQIASTKLIRVFSSRSTIFVYFNRNNDFFLCSTSFLLSCAPPILNKSAHTHTHTHIYKDFFFSLFFSSSPLFFFYIADYFFSPLSLSLLLFLIDESK